jgi:hypothetical protein
MIKLITIRHTIPASDWAGKTTQQWIDEIGGMQTVLSKFANIPASAIRVFYEILFKLIIIT